MRFMYKNIDEIFKQTDVRQTLKTWVNEFHVGRSLYDFCRRVCDTIIICGPPKKTNSVSSLLGHLGKKLIETVSIVEETILFVY